MQGQRLDQHGRPPQQRAEAKAEEAAARERRQGVVDSRHAELGLRIGDEDGGPGLGAQLGLEGVDAAEVVERPARAARDPQPATHRARQRRQAQRQIAAPLGGGGAHRRVDQQLGGAVGRLRQPDEIFHEPAAAREHRHHAEEPDQLVSLRGGEEAPLLELGVKVHLDEEPHRGHRARRLPASDEALDGSPRAAVGLGQEVRIERAHGDALGTRAADLLPQAARSTQHLVPGRRIPDRLFADADGREGNGGREPVLRSEEAGPPPGRGRRSHERLRGGGGALALGDWRAGGDPGAARVAIGDAGLVPVEPVAEPGLEDLKRGGVPAVPPQERQRARPILGAIMGARRRGRHVNPRFGPLGAAAP